MYYAETLGDFELSDEEELTSSQIQYLERVAQEIGETGPPRVFLLWRILIKQQQQSPILRLHEPNVDVLAAAGDMFPTCRRFGHVENVSHNAAESRMLTCGLREASHRPVPGFAGRVSSSASTAQPVAANEMNCDLPPGSPLSKNAATAGARLHQPGAVVALACSTDSWTPFW